MRKPKKTPVCIGCKKKKPDITLAPNPFAAEIHNDFTPVWMCKDCRDKIRQEI